MASTKTHSRRVLPTQIWDEKVRRRPIDHPKTIRPDVCSVVTSGFGGKFVPIKMIPLLREDGILSSRLTLQLQMAELSNMILNPIRLSAMAYFVPKMALERFHDMGSIDRSYNGIDEPSGGVIPWFDKISFKNVDEIWKTLGLHAVDGSDINTDYVESYNAVWNYIAKQRSPSLTLRDPLDTSLAPAFWEHTQMKHVKPTFDDAMMAGNVPLTFVGGSERLPVKSVGRGRINDGGGNIIDRAPSADQSDYQVTDPDGNFDWTDKVWAEMQADSANISIANIDLARETAAWARLRNQFEGVSEDWMMDQLLQGIRIHDDMYHDPILLDHSDTIVGLNERYATDGASLDQSVTDGRTALSLNLRLPPTPCGGVVVVAAQVLPEQVYERQRDHYFVAQSVDELPSRTSDELDPQPVQIKLNGDVDQAHSMPDALFGYEPLNARWMRNGPNVGGKYYRPDPSAPWTEDRNRIWDTNVIDPVLGTDFYLASRINHDVFADNLSDPFEFWLQGQTNIIGNTYFGPALLEATNDYEKVLEQVDTERLKGDGTDVPS